MGVRKTISNPARGSFAWRIKNAREQMGMTQTVLAETSGVQRVLITNWELESQLTHRFEDVLKVAEALDVSLDYMAGLTEEFGCFPVAMEVA
jgi:transcriptional regulator with XRE-family HTH domain